VTILLVVKRSVVVLAFALVLLGSVSCGGGGGSKQLSKAEFENQLGAILRPLQERTLPATVAISPAQPKDAVRRLKDTEADLQDAAAKLGSMKPPADAAPATSQLADGVGKLADRLSAIRKDAEDGSFGRLEAFKLQLTSDPAVAEIRSAATQLITLGYDIAGNAP
jgi:hypothetical protein